MKMMQMFVARLLSKTAATCGNATKPTPAKYANLAAAVMGLSMVSQMYEDKLNLPWFYMVSYGLAILSMLIVVFTGFKKPEL